MLFVTIAYGVTENKLDSQNSIDISATKRLKEMLLFISEIVDFYILTLEENVFIQNITLGHPVQSVRLWIPMAEQHSCGPGS